jgi:hypothetical protein
MTPAFGVGFLSVTAFTDWFGIKRFAGAEVARTVRNWLGAQVLPLLMSATTDQD